jgi:hypothetical protein
MPSRGLGGVFETSEMPRTEAQTASGSNARAASLNAGRMSAYATGLTTGFSAVMKILRGWGLDIIRVRVMD